MWMNIVTMILSLDSRISCWHTTSWLALTYAYINNNGIVQMFYQLWRKIFFLITLGFHLNILSILVDGIDLGKLKIAVFNAQFQCKFYGNRYRFCLYSIILTFILDQDEKYYNIDGEIDYLTTSIVNAEASILAKSQMGKAFYKYYHDIEYVLRLYFTLYFNNFKYSKGEGIQKTLRRRFKSWNRKSKIWK